ncbi:MAG: circadian clock KaiB family protein [Myxococcales bacterium]
MGHQEDALRQNGVENVWNLRLYVAGDSPKSRSAITNLRKLCEAHLKTGYTIEVIDLLKEPSLAKTHQIVAIPTLIRKLPEPIKRVIGDLSDADKALVSLDLSRGGAR